MLVIFSLHHGLGREPPQTPQEVHTSLGGLSGPELSRASPIWELLLAGLLGGVSDSPVDRSMRLTLAGGESAEEV